NGRWKAVSGWSMLPHPETGKPGPKAIRRMVPADSVYFFTARGSAASLAQRWLQSVSDGEQERRDGFGLAVWGAWHSQPHRRYHHMSNTRIYWLHTLSPTHAGIGRGVGYIDLPIDRDGVTGWPIIRGSGFKGVWADSHRATQDARERDPRLRAAFGV